jgi:hypothetical protein
MDGRAVQLSAHEPTETQTRRPEARAHDMSRRRIARRYAVAGSFVVSYRQERGLWFVVRPDRAGRLRRAILPPFRSVCGAISAAHRLPPKR